MSSVGISQRSVGKHILLNKLLGKEVGVCSKQVFLYDRGRIHIDLCAGDGKPNPHSGMCSPGIFSKHTKYLIDKGICTKAVLCEWNAMSANSLFSLWGEHPGVYIERGNALDTFESIKFECPSSIFVFADPNSAASMPINRDFFLDIPEYTTFFCTIGANASGVKRATYEDRMEWKDRLDSVMANMPKHHVAMLCCLEGDSHQWAYLVTGPKCWEKNYAQMTKSAFNFWELGVALYWSKDDDFDRVWSSLFLTTKEKKEMGFYNLVKPKDCENNGVQQCINF